MKLTKEMKKRIEQKVFKKTIDGMLLIAVRMFDAQTDEKDCRSFLLRLLNDDPEAFYARPIIPAKEVDLDVHDRETSC